MALPENDGSLTTAYSAEDITAVSADDASIVDMTSNDYAIHQFKNYMGAETRVAITTKVTTNFSSITSPVIMEIYNRLTEGWDELDRDDSTGTGNITLVGEVTNLTNYKDGNTVISCRVYQRKI